MSNQIATRQRAARFGEQVHKMMARVVDVVPRHMTPERLAAIIRTEGGRNPKLYECDFGSVALCVAASAELGLEPSGTLGHAYLIPRYNKRKGGQECTLIIGYKGLCELARRSGQIRELYAYPVYEHDEFRYELGLSRDLHHVPAAGDRGEVVAAYAVAITHDGGTYFEVLDRAEIDARKPSGDRYSPWTTNYPAMARKTALRALLNGGTVPMAAEVSAAVARAIEVDREYERADVAAPSAETAPTGRAALGLGGHDDPIDADPAQPSIPDPEPAALTDEPPADDGSGDDGPDWYDGEAL